MTRASIERSSTAIATFLMATIPTYVARANLGTTGVQAPDPKKVEVKTYIPDQGPWPYIMVNPDQVSIEASGCNAQKLTITYSINIGISADSPDKAGTVALRYMDILADLIGENITLGGAVDIATLELIDKAAIPADSKAFVVATLRAEVEVATA